MKIDRGSAMLSYAHTLIAMACVQSLVQSSVSSRAAAGIRDSAGVRRSAGGGNPAKYCLYSAGTCFYPHPHGKLKLGDC